MIITKEVVKILDQEILDLLIEIMNLYSTKQNIGDVNYYYIDNHNIRIQRYYESTNHHELTIWIDLKIIDSVYYCFKNIYDQWCTAIDNTVSDRIKKDLISVHDHMLKEKLLTS